MKRNSAPRNLAHQALSGIVLLAVVWRPMVAASVDEDLARAIALLHSSEALSETVERARHYGRRALDALAPFPAGKAKSALTEAVEFAISRAY